MIRNFVRKIKIFLMDSDMKEVYTDAWDYFWSIVKPVSIAAVLICLVVLVLIGWGAAGVIGGPLGFMLYAFFVLLLGCIAKSVHSNWYSVKARLRELIRSNERGFR